MFQPGQQVECIDDQPRGWVNDLCGLTKGRVYTVRWCGRAWNPVDGRYPGVIVAEIDRTDWLYNINWPFGAERFRPLRRTDISVFTALLNPEPAKEPEPCE